MGQLSKRMRKYDRAMQKPTKENRYQIAGTNVKLLFAGCSAMLHSGRSMGWGRTNTGPTYLPTVPTTYEGHAVPAAYQL